MPYYGIEPAAGQTTVDAIIEEFALKEVVAWAYSVGAYYFASRTSSGEVYATVVLEQENEDGPQEPRMFKDIPEYAGPVACCCPRPILELLSPTIDPNANAWRQRCYVWNGAIEGEPLAPNAEKADAIAVAINESLFR